MRSEALFERDQGPEGGSGEDERLLKEAKQELEQLLPPPTPRQRLVIAKRATRTSAQVLAQELVLALKYQLVSAPDPLNIGGEVDILTLPRVRTSLVELVTSATREAEALALVEDGVARSLRQAQETAQATEGEAGPGNSASSS